MSTKRPSDSDSHASMPTTRSKRTKYSSVACEACRTRKLKCNRDPTSSACRRCIENEVECNITRPRRDSSQAILSNHDPNPTSATAVSVANARIDQCERAISDLRRQMAELAESRATPIHDDGTPLSFSHRHVEPQFIGTTRPAFSLRIAKASLADMGVTSDHEDDELWRPDTPTSTTHHSDRFPLPASPSSATKNRDSLLSISLPEVQRLIGVYHDEVQSIYPILDCSQAEQESRIPYLYDRVKTSSLGRFSGTREQKEVHLLKVTLATALLLDDPGKISISHELVRLVEQDSASILVHPSVDLAEIRVTTIMAIYHFYCDQELYAWRVIGIAARMALEMGLHRKESLLQNFPDTQQRTAAVCLFWCVYVLDRRWSLGTGLSFALVSRDIDPELPEPPPSMPYLKSLVSYGHLCTKVWDALPQFGARSHPDASMTSTSASQLDCEIQNWFASVPATFKLTASAYDMLSPDLQQQKRSSLFPPSCPPRGPWILRTFMHLRGNHLRLLVNRQYVLSSDTISRSTQQARLAVHIARDSIRVIVALSKQTDIYSRQQAAYNHFLVSALAIMLLAVSHAPALFLAHQEACRDDFCDAVDLVRGFSESSAAGRRLWKSICGLVSAVSRLGELFVDPTTYRADAEPPDMTHLGVDLMGLFDAFLGQEYANDGDGHPLGHEAIQQQQTGVDLAESADQANIVCDWSLPHGPAV